MRVRVGKASLLALALVVAGALAIGAAFIRTAPDPVPPATGCTSCDARHQGLAHLAAGREEGQSP